MVQQITKKKIHICFGLTNILTALAILLFFIRKTDNLPPIWAFNIGVDILSLFVCIALLFSCMQDKKNYDMTTNTFATLLVSNAFAVFFDECCWIVNDNSSLIFFNKLANVLYYSNAPIVTFLFWRYVTNALNMESKLMRIADKLLNILLAPTVLLCWVNMFYPLYFTVDELGAYHRLDRFYYSYFYLAIATVTIVIGLIRSKAPARQKWIAFTFVAIPILNQVFTGAFYGISTQYASTLVSIVIIYGVLFADRGKSLAATEKELSLATRIQSDMLPNIFPAFPERKEFDIYATMNPAKEVGGDFYDFFLIDDDHLAIVIADVAGKGIPAALFMMVSKILVQNFAMTGRSPKEVLQITNEQICSKNREEMFVTVWLGILDLTTGKLIASNAGHEYPILKKPDGDFELIKDKHSFVVGGMDNVNYKEYELQLEKGSKLFLYTDGVAEASNLKKEQFGTTRTLEALNSVKNESPENILNTVNDTVSKFVCGAPQFDDLTMLCIEYNGK
ncbi:MAG: serine/threonine-protein phosphatase [Treponema sp.]|nr:serine/threonine-protein phosphatase [Treponema sp.]